MDNNVSSPKRNKISIDALKPARSKRHVTRYSCVSSGESMKELSGLLIGTLVLLLFVPFPVFAGEVSGSPGGDTDPSISAVSAAPALTTAPPSLVRNPQLVVRTTVTPQATGVLILESVPSGALVYVDGTLRGITPLTLRTIATGVHPISFTLTGYLNYTTKATVTAGAVATSSATLAPVITTTITPSVSSPAAGAIPIPVTTTRETVTTAPPVTTVFPVITRVTRQITSPLPVRAGGIPSGSGEMGTSADGRLNCTVIISSNDQIMTLSVHGRYAGDRCRKNTRPGDPYYPRNPV